MNANESIETEFDDDGIDIAELLERAERTFRSGCDNKYYATREEIFLLMSQPDLEQEPRVELDCGGNWVIEIYYSKMIFIQVTSYQVFTGERVH